jgi:D-xylose transport system substrate-binding protein
MALSLLSAISFFTAIAVAPAGADEKADIRIGFLLKTMQEERYQTDKALFIARAESLGAEVLFDSSANDELLQLQQFEALLDDDVDVVVLQPVNTGTAGALVRLANKRGVKVVGYDSLLTNGPLDAMVMQDSWAVGRLQGEAMVNWFRRVKGEVKGRVALIKGQPGDSNAEALSRGALEIIKQHPGLELVAERSHVDWSPDIARETADSLLVKHRNQVDAFICNNSGLAYGVVAALRSEGLASVEKVFVAGADADLRNIQFVAAGEQSLEVWKKIKPLAYKAAEIAVELARAPDAPVTEVIGEFTLVDNGFAKIPTIITPVVAVTRETIDSTVIEGGFFTREQVYGK